MQKETKLAKLGKICTNGDKTSSHLCQISPKKYDINYEQPLSICLDINWAGKLYEISPMCKVT